MVSCTLRTYANIARKVHNFPLHDVTVIFSGLQGPSGIALEFPAGALYLLIHHV